MSSTASTLPLFLAVAVLLVALVTLGKKEGFENGLPSNAPPKADPTTKETVKNLPMTRGFFIHNDAATFDDIYSGKVVGATGKFASADFNSATFGTMKTSGDVTVGGALTGKDATLRDVQAANIKALYTASGEIMASDKICIGDQCIDGPMMSTLVKNQGKGIAGPIGPTGPQGKEGPQGPIGQAGPIGPIGKQGPPGPKGDIGPVGPKGATGAQGPAGLSGKDGARGPPGPAGQDGAKGATGAPGPQGATGSMGPPGPRGVGVDSISSIETTRDNKLLIRYKNDVVAPIELPLTNMGYIASMDFEKASNTIIVKYANGKIQNIQIPTQSVEGVATAGAPGPQGPQGQPGPQGPQGIRGDPGPKGDTGAQGPQGPPGPGSAFNKKLGHSFGEWTDRSELTVWTKDGEYGASFGGPNHWSHFPWVDKNTYIRPGGDNKAVMIGDVGANYIQLGKGDTNVAVKGTLGIHSTPEQWNWLHVHRGDGDQLFFGGDKANRGIWSHGERPFSIYTSNKQRFAIDKDGGVNIGNGEGTTNVNSWRLLTNRHLDASQAWGDKNPNPALFMNWFGGKTVVGNHKTGGHDFAYYAPENTVVATNPLHVHGEVKSHKLQLGDKFLFSGVGDAHGNDNWLRMFDAEGKGYKGGIAMADLWVGNNSYLNGTTNISNAKANYVTSDRHIDATVGWGDKNPNPALFMNWHGGKTVVGNHKTGGHDFAYNAPENTVVATNPLHVHGEVKSHKLQLGDKFLFSGVGDAHGNDNWLRMFDAKGEGYRGGIAMADLWVGNNSYLNGTTNISNAKASYVSSDRHIDATVGWGDKNPNPALFMNWHGGKTVIGNHKTGGHDFAYNAPENTVVATNPLHVHGDTNVSNNLNVQNRLHFKDASMSTTPNDHNNSDPYWMEKVSQGGNNSHLRLTINDDPDESFQIWGDSCRTTECHGSGVMRHRFGADGSVHVNGGDASFTTYGPNSSWGSHLAVGAGPSRINGNTAQVLSTNGNLHLDAAQDRTLFLNHYNQGAPVYSYGPWKHHNTLTTTDKICINNTCISESQLKDVLAPWTAPNVIGWAHQFGTVGTVKNIPQLWYAIHGRLNVTFRLRAVLSDPAPLTINVNNGTYSNPQIYVQLGSPYTGTVILERANAGANDWKEVARQNVSNASAIFFDYVSV